MAFVAIATLSSCSQQEEFFSGGTQSPLDENVVTFGTYLGQALQTRATSIGTEELKAGPGFGVFAYYTEEADFAENTFIPDFMRNQKVAWNGSEWFYTPLKYWPSNDNHKISFFAYAPYAAEADAANNSITSLPEMGTKLEDGTVTKPSDPVIGFTLNPDYKKQTDLLYNDAEFTANLMKQSIDQKCNSNSSTPCLASVSRQWLSLMKWPIKKMEAYRVTVAIIKTFLLVRDLRSPSTALLSRQRTYQNPAVCILTQVNGTT